MWQVLEREVSVQNQPKPPPQTTLMETLSSRTASNLFDDQDVVNILLPGASETSNTGSSSLDDRAKDQAENRAKDQAEHRLEWPLTHGRRTKVIDLVSDRSVDGPTDFGDKLETGVKNGDCLLACFATLLECMFRGSVSPTPMHKAAAGMRALVTDYIKSKWKETLSLNKSMSVSEIMAMAHDVPDERDDEKPWVQRIDQGLEAYSEKCDSVYCCDAEMLMFSNLMFERGVNIVFRAWKWRPKSKSSELVSITPDIGYFKMYNVQEVYVIDLEHSGTNDGGNAHYKLIEGGALVGLLEVETRRPRSAVPPVSPVSPVSPVRPPKKRRMINISKA